ncbi:PaaI family thioesterase [Hasllibacter sp. MH4015]|uniref:PaaI family thioesterase n=1 Tax=Hasllibacter sp. MH4015 TaxID=2854029 RepID=UPI001CD317A1|nr:PaaI family thioesterase [Hasllibacter sp. MH4015]
MSDLDPDLAEAPYPLEAHLGYRLTRWSKDRATVEMPIAPHIQNRQGLPHGGIHATLLDTAMGYAGCFTGDRDAPRMALTLSLNVNYLSRPKGALLIATARRTGGGRSTFFAEGEVRDDLGTVIATSTGVFRYRDR